MHDFDTALQGTLAGICGCEHSPPVTKLEFMSDPGIQVAPVRRTQRVQISMPVLVRGKAFEEFTTTIAVNAHGCLVLLKTTVMRDDLVSLVNPKTAEELPSKVVSLGKPEEGKIPVGIEFSEASPLFWQISFPPDDWLTSAERKRPGVSASKR
jgi:hypothetical protein